MDENTEFSSMPEEELFYNINIPEQIFQAIDIIVKKRLEQLPYDQTIEAQIIKNDRAMYGEYTVKTKSELTFKAYSNDCSYQMYQWVFVRIPQGDYTKQKTITGPIITEDSEYLIGTPTTVEQLMSSPFSDYNWQLTEPENTDDLFSSMEASSKYDMLKQYLEYCKTRSEYYIEKYDAIKQFYLDTLEEYFELSGGLVKTDDGKLTLKDAAPADQLPSLKTNTGFWVNGAANKVRDWATSYVQYNYLRDIDVYKEQWLAQLTPNRKIIEKEKKE